ncbi:MAG: dUTP diphosphatase, partial [Inquilinus sp.]|nr:dUTP diphosphatase [Inquilinus sp.]
MTALTIPIARLAHARDLPLPQAATAHAAGVDLLAAVDGEMALAPGERAL